MESCTLNSQLLTLPPIWVAADCAVEECEEMGTQGEAVGEYGSVYWGDGVELGEGEREREREVLNSFSHRKYITTDQF